MTKIMKVFVPALVLSAFVSLPQGSVHAQENFWGVAYTTGLTSGDASDYIDSFSWRGIEVNYRRLQTRNLSWGFTAGWQVFHDKSFQLVEGTLPIEEEEIGGAISGTQYRYINAFPLLATGYYTYGPSFGTQFYGGAGVGAYYVERRTELGLVAITKDTWHFGATPELGVIFPVGSDAKMYFNAKYNWTATSSDVNYNFFSFNVGFAAVSF
jgi:opacity protein-like surface antigen